MKTIPLTKGKFATIDDEDYSKVSHLSWYASKEKNGLWYARAYLGRGYKKYSSIRMHRLILGMNKQDKRQVDHLNSNGLDNRKHNLRIATNAQNSMNRRKQKGCSSIYKGVYWNKVNRRWLAYIYLNRKKISLGSFIDEKSAAQAYNNKAKELFGEYALLNKL